MSPADIPFEHRSFNNSFNHSLRPLAKAQAEPFLFRLHSLPEFEVIDFDIVQ
jgi:hypothetical protein